jgi:hypothetical protein
MVISALALSLNHSFRVTLVSWGDIPAFRKNEQKYTPWLVQGTENGYQRKVVETDSPTAPGEAPCSIDVTQFRKSV